MSCERNDDITYYVLFIVCIAACKKVSCHDLAIVSMQCKLRERNLLEFWKRKSESVGDWCNGKGIQSAYFRYDSEFSKCKQSFWHSTVLNRCF